MSLYVAVVFSALVAVLLVYRYDLYNREPWYMILLACAAGFVTMRIVGSIELLSLRFAEGLAAAALGAVHEELARLALVGAFAAIFPGQFDDPMDGIIYGSIVGLGMGVEESFSLLNLLRQPNVLTLPVELVRLLGHLVMGGIAGFGVGLAWLRTAGWPRALSISFALAVALHFSWDSVALASPDGASLPGMRSLLAAGIMLAGMTIYGKMVMLGSRFSKEYFDPQSSRSLWGWPFERR